MACTWTRRDPQRPRERTRGMSYVHSAIDAYSRLAYSEIHDDERGPTCAAFLERASSSSRLRHRPRSTRSSPTTPRPTPASTSPHALGGVEHRRIRPYTPTHQRQGRTVQPHPPRRMGIRPPLHLRRRTHRRPGRMAAHLQPSPLPHRHRRPTRQPRQQPTWALQPRPLSRSRAADAAKTRGTFPQVGPGQSGVTRRGF